jgi:biopolymer transport protein ExbB/TolQ
MNPFNRLRKAESEERQNYREEAKEAEDRHTDRQLARMEKNMTLLETQIKLIELESERK